MARRSRPARRLPDDVAFLHSPTEDGGGARVLRLRKGELYAGEVRPALEGKPIGQHEVVRLKPLAADSRLCEVEVVHAPATRSEPAPRAESSGPSRVATDNYRRNWSHVFGASRAGTARELPN